MINPFLDQFGNNLKSYVVIFGITGLVLGAFFGAFFGVMGLLVGGGIGAYLFYRMNPSKSTSNRVVNENKNKEDYIDTNAERRRIR